MPEYSLQQVRKMLPDFAWALGASRKSVDAIRAAVMQELQMYRDGNNPLTESQVRSLQKFLKKVPEQPRWKDTSYRRDAMGECWTITIAGMDVLIHHYVGCPVEQWFVTTRRPELVERYPLSAVSVEEVKREAIDIVKRTVDALYEALERIVPVNGVLAETITFPPSSQRPTPTETGE